MATARPHQVPAIFFKHPNSVANLHSSARIGTALLTVKRLLVHRCDNSVRRMNLGASPPTVQEAYWLPGRRNHQLRLHAKPCTTSTNVILYCHMSHTITIRLNEELADWLEETSRKTGLPAGKIVREQLEKAKNSNGNRRFLRFAGKINGPADLSMRKGFTKR